MTKNQVHQFPKKGKGTYNKVLDAEAKKIDKATEVKVKLKKVRIK